MDFMFDLPQIRLLDGPVSITKTDHEEEIKEYLRGIYADAKAYLDGFNEPIIRNEISKIGDEILDAVLQGDKYDG